MRSGKLSLRWPSLVALALLGLALIVLGVGSDVADAGHQNAARLALVRLLNGLTPPATARTIAHQFEPDNGAAPPRVAHSLVQLAVSQRDFYSAAGYLLRNCQLIEGDLSLQLSVWPYRKEIVAAAVEQIEMACAARSLLTLDPYNLYALSLARDTRAVPTRSHHTFPGYRLSRSVDPWLKMTVSYWTDHGDLVICTANCDAVADSLQRMCPSGDNVMVVREAEAFATGSIFDEPDGSVSIWIRRETIHLYLPTLSEQYSAWIHYMSNPVREIQVTWKAEPVRLPTNKNWALVRLPAGHTALAFESIDAYPGRVDKIMITNCDSWVPQ
jgi:hypothetical protein